MEEIRVLLWGLGAMGSGMARMLLDKTGVRIAGAIDRRAEFAGRDLGSVLGLDRELGIAVEADAGKALEAAGPGGIVMHATGSFVSEIAGQILLAVQHGFNVISIAEEMSFPWYPDHAIAERIDAAARQAGVSVFGTGINPGFVLDLLIIALTSVCRRVDAVEARRVNDLSPFGPTVMRTQGVGTTAEDFRKGVASGEIVGHVGFHQSVRLIGEAVGWEIERVEEKLEPIISSVRRETPHVVVEPGMIAGCNHTAIGYSGGCPVITLLHPQQVRPEAENVRTGDYITVVGDPPVSFSGAPEIPGGIGTIASAVNRIPSVVAARPGLLDLNDLPIPAARMANFRRFADRETR